jgi:hypothetical protein
VRSGRVIVRLLDCGERSITGDLCQSRQQSITRRRQSIMTTRRNITGKPQNTMKPETPRPRPITHIWPTAIINTQPTTRARQQRPTLPITTNQKPQKPNKHSRIVTANGSRDTAPSGRSREPRSSLMQGPLQRINRLTILTTCLSLGSRRLIRFHNF